MSNYTLIIVVAALLLFLAVGLSIMVKVRPERKYKKVRHNVTGNVGDVLLELRNKEPGDTEWRIKYKVGWIIDQTITEVREDEVELV